jgi:small conductance mechanosensitive channel
LIIFENPNHHNIHHMSGFLNDIWIEVQQYYGFLVRFTPRFFMAMMILIAAWIITRQIRNITDRKLKQRMEDPLLAEFLATMTRTILIIIAITISFRVMGFGGVTAGILAGAGITAFVIGFALRDIGENFLAGILMAFKRPFKVGDFVETNNIRGRVVALSIRDTHVKTPDGKDVFIPNANIVKTPLVNWTIDGFLRFDLVVGLPAGVDVDDIQKKLEAAANSVEGIIRRRRKTTVHISGISPGRLEATISFWIDTFRTKDSTEKIRSEVIKATNMVLNELQ